MQIFWFWYILAKVILRTRKKDGNEMATLLETWRNLAYGDGLDDKKKEELWNGYFQIEKGIYEQILSAPEQVVEGTVKELADKYHTEVLIMTGFLDGINESLKGYESRSHNSLGIPFDGKLEPNRDFLRSTASPKSLRWHLPLTP